MITPVHVRGGIAGPAVDFKEVFGPRHQGEAVAPHVHEEPRPRVPDYDQIARLVSSPVKQDQAREGDRPDAKDGERRTAVPAR
jgi:hypothetical protein